MKNLFTRVLALTLAVFMALALGGCGNSETETSPSAEAAAPTASATPSVSDTYIITDMAGREVEVPRNINTVMTLHPVPTYCAWRLGGEKLINVDANFSKLYSAEDAVSVVDYYTQDALDFLRTLPVTDTWMSGIDAEIVLDLAPDLILTLTQDSNADKLQEETGIPVFCIVKAPVTEQADSYRLVGRLLGNEEQGNHMADFVQGILDRMDAEVAQINESDKIRVMFCGKSGNLYGVPGAGSVYATTLEAAGGINVSNDLEQTDSESVDVTMEQMMVWNPDVIICQTMDERETLLTAPEWSGLSAVQNGQVYVPLQYTSCDGIAAVLGIEWLNYVLYHNGDAAYLEQLYTDISRFHELFYDQTLTQEQLEMPATGW